MWDDLGVFSSFLQCFHSIIYTFWHPTLNNNNNNDNNNNNNNNGLLTDPLGCSSLLKYTKYNLKKKSNQVIYKLCNIQLKVEGGLTEPKLQ